MLYLAIYLFIGMYFILSLPPIEDLIHNIKYLHKDEFDEAYEHIDEATLIFLIKVVIILLWPVFLFYPED